MNKLNGKFKFQTIKVADGNTRYVVTVTGTFNGKHLTVCGYGSWDGKFPANLALVNSNGYRDPETGMIRSITDALNGEVEFDETQIKEIQGRIPGTIITTVRDVPVEKFIVSKNNVEFVACTL